MNDATYREIPLTRGKVARVDAEDYERVSALKWSANRVAGLWYARHFKKVKGKNVSISLHRFILGLPPGVWIDHCDGDGLNNRKSNIRTTSKCGNAQNRRAINKTGMKGVYWRADCKKWFVSIKANGINYYLGLYSNLNEAAAAYDAAALKHHGDFARLNFPNPNRLTR